ncbi:DNA-directed RNA polymerase III subunit RPC8-like isoform X1 [Iris pallida]|uniref:DNA-directed RNA polymerase subunit n=1 Tax=Iris pallida TaxID=29817 RepID=A0AAX6GEQ8_IRIPA|nr:DNA-directed RNA polymerase III subunit RPC8-like isoform X1 [Iris pallida]KAJ6827159.1 DNA-directed RNA polymerase III subunit RPC8-like isoform X1 [Iris pallida]
MFNLSLIEHDLPLPPRLLSLPLTDAIKGELENLFLDKVIANLGLCISVYDIQSIEGGFIVPGDGCSRYKVVFRLLMFRPFIGEVLTGTIEESDANGLHLSLGFFSDIYVPVHLLPIPNKRDANGLWIWIFDTEELALDLNEKIRFRVKNIKFPPMPIEQDDNAKPFAPMEITAEICQEGLGLVSWWGD